MNSRAVSRPVGSGGGEHAWGVAGPWEGHPVPPAGPVLVPPSSTCALHARLPCDWMFCTTNCSAKQPKLTWEHSSWTKRNGRDRILGLLYTWPMTHMSLHDCYLQVSAVVS